MMRKIFNQFALIVTGTSQLRTGGTASSQPSDWTDGQLRGKRMKSPALDNSLPFAYLLSHSRETRTGGGRISTGFKASTVCPPFCAEPRIQIIFCSERGRGTKISTTPIFSTGIIGSLNCKVTKRPKTDPRAYPCARKEQSL